MRGACVPVIVLTLFAMSGDASVATSSSLPVAAASASGAILLAS